MCVKLPTKRNENKTEIANWRKTEIYFWSHPACPPFLQTPAWLPSRAKAKVLRCTCWGLWAVHITKGLETDSRVWAQFALSLKMSLTGGSLWPQSRIEDYVERPCQEKKKKNLEGWMAKELRFFMKNFENQIYVWVSESMWNAFLTFHTSMSFTRNSPAGTVALWWNGYPHVKGPGKEQDREMKGERERDRSRKVDR